MIKGIASTILGNNSLDSIGTALDKVPSALLTKKFGINEAVGTSFTELWDEGTAYPWFAQTSAVALAVQSADNVKDIAGQAGANQATVYGLDANWRLQKCIVNLNGTTAVSLPGLWRRVFRIQLGCGSDGYNTGKITVTDGSANVWAAVAAGGTLATSGYGNQTQMLVFTTPANTESLLYRIGLTAEGLSSQEVELHLGVRDNTETYPTWRNKRAWKFAADTSFEICWQTAPLSIGEKCDVAFVAKVNSGTTFVSGNFDVMSYDVNHAKLDYTIVT